MNEIPIVKFLISTPRDEKYCLVGYDWDNNEVFWALEKDKYRKLTLGICYENDNLITASFNALMRLTPTEAIKTRIREGYGTRLHSVHPIGNELIAVANPANDCIQTVDREGNVVETVSLRVEGDLRYDLYHLNDFTVTPYGILGTVFGYRPWRVFRDMVGLDKWSRIPLGMVINISDYGRVVACGLTAPHSINAINDKVFVCSSHSGELVCYEQGPILKELWRKQFTDRNRFFRGMHIISETEYFVGACRMDHSESVSTAKIFYIYGNHIDWRVAEEFTGMYDLLPWREEVLGPIINKHFS